MRPALLHADGTDCYHEGRPQRIATDDQGPACPAGIEVTHVRFNGKAIPLPDAISALQQAGQKVADMLQPMIAQMVQHLNEVVGSPQIRVLAGAAAAIEQEREREARQGELRKAGDQQRPAGRHHSLVGHDRGGPAR